MFQKMSSLDKYHFTCRFTDVWRSQAYLYNLLRSLKQFKTKKTHKLVSIWTGTHSIGKTTNLVLEKSMGKKKKKNYLCSWRIVPIIQFNLFIKICYLSQASNFNHFTRYNFICYYGMFPTKFLPHDLTELVETDSRCSLWKLNRLSSWSLSLSSGVVSSPPTTLTVLWISSNLSSSISNCRSRIRLNTLMLVLPAVKPEII